MVSRGHPFVPWQANHHTMSLPRRACPLRSPRGRIPLPPPTGMATRLTGAAPRHRRAADCWHGQPPVFMVPLTSPASWHTPSFSRAVHVCDSRHRSAPFVWYAKAFIIKSPRVLPLLLGSLHYAPFVLTARTTSAHCVALLEAARGKWYDTVGEDGWLSHTSAGRVRLTTARTPILPAASLFSYSLPPHDDEALLHHRCCGVRMGAASALHSAIIASLHVASLRSRCTAH